MNIMGKILVILNLVAALVVCFLLAADFATRSNWKKFNDGLKREMDIGARNGTVMVKTAEDLDKQVKQLRDALESEKQARSNDKVDLVNQVKLAKAMADEEAQKAKEADLSSQKLLGEVTRTKEEVKVLNKVVEDRQKKIVEMEKIHKELRDFSLAKEKESQDDRARNENLKDENLKLRLLTAELQAPQKGGKLSAPPVNVKGVIEKVDLQAGLVQISLGSDEGLKKNHVLQVRRLKPRPEYLGSIQIVDVEFHKAVGRWMSPRPEGKRLRPGDQVVSSLSR